MPIRVLQLHLRPHLRLLRPHASHSRRSRALCTQPPSLPDELSAHDVLHLYARLNPLLASLRARHTALLAQPTLRPAEAAELRGLSPLSDALSTAAAAEAELADVRQLHDDAAAARDADLASLARDEAAALEVALAAHARSLIAHVLSRHRADAEAGAGGGGDGGVASRAIVELRAGTGGDEAALFVADLAAMYERLCARRGWAVSELSRAEETRAGGLRELILRVSGRGARHALSGEAGVHRVQRVPATETAGRVHTSTASVAVLTDDREAASKVVLEDGAVRVDVYRASGAGGQHVNKTESAVRVTHIATGLVATSQEDRSQHRNRALAMEALAARIAAKEAAERAAKRVAERRMQLGATAGERSDRIRTYNVPQRRVTDHRVVVDDGLLAVLPGAREVVGDKSADLAGVLEGGPALDGIVAAVHRVGVLRDLQEIIRGIESVGKKDGATGRRRSKKKAAAAAAAAAAA